MTEWSAVREPYQMITAPEGTDLDGPGAYRLEGRGETLYVGGTSNLGQRLGDHRRAGLLSVVTFGVLYPCNTQHAAMELERSLIWLFKPSQNRERPKPSGPLWATFLLVEDPKASFSWFQGCGHIEVGGHAIIDREGALDCHCKPWTDWFEVVRDRAEFLEEVASQFMQERNELQAELAREHERTYCERCGPLSDEIDRLSTLLGRAEWHP